VLVGTAIGQAAGQAWPPFVLIAGLLLIGAVVEAERVHLDDGGDRALASGEVVELRSS
jgi:hypothetical protein